MSDVNLYLPILRTLEGGMDRDTYDPMAKYPCPTPFFGEYGWHTNAGITWKLWSEEIGNDVTATTRWFNMSDSDLAFIVSKVFWNPLSCSAMNSQKTANMICDYGFNSGEGTAAIQVQRLLGCTADGIIGVNTLTLINAGDPDIMYENIMNQRLAYYESLNNPNEIQGWKNRIAKLDAYNQTLSLNV